MLWQVRGAIVVLAACVNAGCGASGPRPSPARAKLAACVQSWNASDSDRHREALAIVRSGALPDTGVFITTHAPRGEPGEVGASRTVQVGPGRCVVGEERNTIFVFAGGGWRMINPTDSSDPAMDVINAAGDHPNADADVQGRIALAR